MIIALLLVAAPAAAQSTTDGWQFSIAPYLWASGMDGTLRIGDREQEVDASFSDIVDNLDIALMGHFDMRNERWVLASDLIYVDLGQEKKLEAGTVTAGLDMTIVELLGGYRVSPAVALLLGARWVDAGVDLAYDGDFAVEDADAGESWLDPVIGVHALAPLSERWWVGFRGDIGGFGVGSELSWQAYADLGFRASGLISVMIGYHALDIDYEGGSGTAAVDLNLVMSGPQLGVVFTF
ncbi:MAG TPA: hypothetical protein VLT32_02775 [Candidatus Sulfomarinibacteraceae bacterium]|nr:hypothetical protein [Candidatus Sulfomarinibacteraceae bacterium]